MGRAGTYAPGGRRRVHYSRREICPGDFDDKGLRLAADLRAGLEVMRQVKPRCPIRGIAPTGYGTEDDIRQSRATGFDGGRPCGAGRRGAIGFRWDTRTQVIESGGTVLKRTPEQTSRPGAFVFLRVGEGG